MTRQVVAEALGTALLLAIIVGSGIMGEKLAAGNAAVTLLANSIATGAGLYALIVMFGPISGAHFNPVISIVSFMAGSLKLATCMAYIVVQLAGAFIGVAAAHAMFGLPIIQVSAHLRSTPGEALGEIIATFGLVLVIVLTSRLRRNAVAVAVACFITSAYWFTSSTSFANPAVTLARATTATFAGISPESAPLFLGAQFVGAAAAAFFGRWLVTASATQER